MKNKIIIALILIVIVVTGLILGHNKLWWFTPVYSQRQTVHAFFGDLAKGKSRQAYDLTSTAFQANNSFTSFETQYNVFSTSSVNTSFKNYAISKGYVSITGSTSTSTENLRSNFGVNLIKVNGQNKIDSIFVSVK